MNKINFSIIIAHKNIPFLLQRCLNSIPVREDVQVIVVDDCSDPQTVNFNNYPKWDGKEYLTLFLKRDNGDSYGCGYARNKAMNYVKGKFITYLDADDLFTNSVSSIMDKYRNAFEDVIMFNIKRMACETMTILKDEENWYNKKILDTRMKPIDLMMDLSIGGAKFYRTSKIKKHNITWDEIKYHSDTMFVTRALVYSNKVKVCPNDYLYVWTVRTDSLSNTINKQAINDHVSSEIRRYKLVKRERKDIHLGNYQIELLLGMKQLRFLEQIPLIAKMFTSGLMFNVSIYEPIKRSRIIWQICSTLKKGIVNQFSQS